MALEAVRGGEVMCLVFDEHNYTHKEITLVCGCVFRIRYLWDATRTCILENNVLVDKAWLVYPEGADFPQKIHPEGCRGPK